MAPLVFAGTTLAHGFAEAASLLPAIGGLSDTNFETGGRTYTVRSSTVSVGGSLVFGLDRALTDAEADRLVLHVCGEAYALSDASYDSGTRRYTWSGAGLDWSSVTTRTLRLREPSDITPPESSSAATIGSGNIVALGFTEPVDKSNLPAPSAFTVTADGNPSRRLVTGNQVIRNCCSFGSLPVSARASGSF